MCVPIFLQKFSVGREFFLSPTLNIIQPKKEAVPEGLLHQFFCKYPYTYCACYQKMNQVASIKQVGFILHNYSTVFLSLPYLT